MHSKESLIAPAFLKNLDMVVEVAGCNTDLLGTFSGEIERIEKPFEVAEKKARMGMSLKKLHYGIANEGSFGPHPFIPFITINTEIMIFIDDEIGLKIHETKFTAETNFSHTCLSSLKEAEEFLKNVQFPSHGIIVRANKWQKNQKIFKGITDILELEKSFLEAKKDSVDGKVWLESDMRAHMNPTRMKFIGELAEKLSLRLAQFCPACNSPGFGMVGIKAGLICEYCGSPTEMIESDIYGCNICDYKELHKHDPKTKFAHPFYCQICNP
jgi:hypothetical protein